MQRVLHITGTMNRGGAETSIMNWYRVIDRTMYQFDFLYFTDAKCDFDEEIAYLGGRIYRILGSNQFQRMILLVKFLSSNTDWKTIHAHNLLSNAFHVYAAYLAGIEKRITHSHSTSCNIEMPIIRLLYPRVSRFIQKNYATDFVACSREAADFMFLRNSDAIILKNSIDVEKFIRSSETSRDYLRVQHKLSKECLILIQVGRLSHAKNHEYSLRIAHELVLREVKFKLFFAGDGILSDALRLQVEKMKLGEFVEFMGVRKDVAELLSGSDLMLLPSLYEGFGVVLLEAQAAGTPSLISDNIPSDSDLDIGLISVLSLDEPPYVWANRIEKVVKNKIIVNPLIRDKFLKLHGYDHEMSVRALVDLYN